MMQPGGSGGGPTVEITESLRPGARVLSVAGELDLCSAPDAKRVIEGALADPERALVLDFARCEFIDSTGLQQLVKAVRSANGSPKSRVVLVCNPDGAVARTLRLTGLWGRLETHAGVEAALAALG